MLTLNMRARVDCPMMHASIESLVSDQIMDVSAEIFGLIELRDWAVKASPSCKSTGW